MRMLARVRQLAKSRYVVQVARLEPFERTSSPNWSDQTEFNTEQAAELFARSVLDAQGKGRDVPSYYLRSFSTPQQGKSGYWMYPTRNCRVPI